MTRFLFLYLKIHSTTCYGLGFRPTPRCVYLYLFDFKYVFLRKDVILFNVIEIPVLLQVNIYTYISMDFRRGNGS